MRLGIRKFAGNYPSVMMYSELSVQLRRGRYQRRNINLNYLNGSYPRKFTSKGIGRIDLKVPINRNTTFKTTLLPRRR
jgi:transposase-like protein